MAQNNWLFLAGQRRILAAYLAATPNLYLHLFTSPVPLTVGKVPGDFTDAAWTGSTPQALAGGALTAGNPDDKAEITWDQQEYTNGSSGSVNVKGYWIKDHTNNEAIFGVVFNSGDGVDVPAGTTLRITPKYRNKSSCPAEEEGGGGDGAFWWPVTVEDYDGGSGTTVADPISSNLATASGTIAIGTDHPTTGYSVDYSGGGKLVTAAPIVDTSEPFTVTAWAKIADHAGTGTVQFMVTWDGDSGISFSGYYSSGNWHLEFLTESGNGLDEILPSNPEGGWHMFAVRFNGTHQQMFFDGLPIGTADTATATTTSAVAYMGGTSGGGGNHMKQTDTHVFNSALTNGQILTMYEAGAP